MTRVLARLEGIDNDFAELASARDRWLDAKMRIHSRHGSLSPNARFHLANEARFGLIGAVLPTGVSEASLIQLRSLLDRVIASRHAFPDVELKVTPKKGIPDPKIHRRTETLDDGTIRVL